MRCIAQIILFTFFLFLITPPIVSLIKNDACQLESNISVEKEKIENEMNPMILHEIVYTSLNSISQIRRPFYWKDILKYKNPPTPVILPPPDTASLLVV